MTDWQETFLLLLLRHHDRDAISDGKHAFALRAFQRVLFLHRHFLDRRFIVGTGENGE